MGRKVLEGGEEYSREEKSKPTGFYTFQRYYVRADVHLEAQDQNQIGRGAFVLTYVWTGQSRSLMKTLFPFSPFP